ncbi:hypothetical protein PRIC2_014064 [Phytophthora ramorum]
MPKDRFISANPYPDVHVSEEERQQLIELVDGFVQDYFQKYQDFVVVDKHTVDERRWAHVKSKDNLHIYTERSVKELARKGLVAKNHVIEATSAFLDSAVELELRDAMIFNSIVLLERIWYASRFWKASEMGRIGAMEWLLSHRYVKHPNMAIFAAVEKDRLDVVTLDDTEQVGRSSSSFGLRCEVWPAQHGEVPLWALLGWNSD